jgi:hypothetical protein
MLKFAECRLCNKKISLLIFENHIKMCHKVNLSKIQLKKVNDIILGICEDLESKLKSLMFKEKQ